MELTEDGRIADMVRKFHSSVTRNSSDISIDGRFIKNKSFFGKNP
jgi:hypothetical protein